MNQNKTMRRSYNTGKILRFPWMWHCPRCHQLKDLKEYQKNANTKNGYANVCRECANKRRAEWTKRNPEKQRAHERAWAARNAARMAAYRKQWAKEKGPEYCREKSARWRRANPVRNALVQAERYASMLRATPGWAKRSAIEEIYRKAVDETKATGIKHTVDHIVPLKSKTVCGLHWEGNLRVITSSENSIKGNRTWPDKP